MVRVSDEEMKLVWSALDEREQRGQPLDPKERTALDLRDARALLREAEQYMNDGEDKSPEVDLYERIRQHLEGHDG